MKNKFITVGVLVALIVIVLFVYKNFNKGVPAESERDRILDSLSVEGGKDYLSSEEREKVRATLSGSGTASPQSDEERTDIIKALSK